ncbi:membrane protein insertase YidC [Kerstersia similis]|uniref:membrane protein insertase YidC n=1 Tax=Kerstersia similis TaxID=206505 RepID=UPI0039EE05DE
MDIRRTILWMIFLFSLLLLWNNWQVHNGKSSLFAPSSTEAAATTPNAATPGTPADASVPASAAPTPPAAASLPGAAPVGAATADSKPFTIDNGVLRLDFDLNGAQIVRGALLKFQDSEDETRPEMLLDNVQGNYYVVQTGAVGSTNGTPFPNHLTPFSLVSHTQAADGSQVVVFEAQSGGALLRKTYTLQQNRYDIHVRHEVINQSEQAIAPSLYLQITRDGNNPPNTSSFYSTFTGPAVYSDAEKFQKVSFSDIEKNKAKYERETNNGWIGMVQHYFVTAWVPPQGTLRKNELVQIQPNLYAARTIESLGAIAPGASAGMDAQLWVGPQDQKALSEVAPGLDLVVDYGWLTIIAKPLFVLLTWLHSLLHNWGWSIVALTVLIKLLFFPLASASYRSMARMKNVAPRLQALKQKYGDDRAKLNAAMMELYRTEKINPLGGCLPMVVQIPVFIALYWVLLASVEMRDAPWILWVHNLAAPDPFFILPAVMMITMFVQIKLNPTPPDPIQAKVMMIMPLVFGGMMFFFPAGLVLYWCVNNALSIAQQWVITRKITQASAKAANS